jgi:hypothetical protein
MQSTSHLPAAIDFAFTAMDNAGAAINLADAFEVASAYKDVAS